ncbi:DUF998 domain-containing protein [Streptomyces chryseus]|uniref:DUF998 domain-containing protein n=1 Tax=Streptomyces chryseus TaxID=68186 RepID=UPI00110F8F9E|nr:DUF998 domain-containing protein [Streptomyces chryseus]GGX25234.1 hypothetical protein GCM10010353_45210 [Streptomyces chryseus]
MTHTISAPTSAVPTASAPAARPAGRVLLACGAAAGPLFLGVGLVQGLTRAGFDFTRNAISQLSLGDLGWIQVAGFLVAGALMIAGAVGLRRALDKGPGHRAAPWLVGVFGTSFLVSGVFAADPGVGFPAGTPDSATSALSVHGAVHMTAGMVGYLALCAAFLVLARHFAGRRQRGWAIACRLAPVGVLAGFAGSAASVLSFTAGAAFGLAALTTVAVRLTRRQPDRRASDT